jgi:hypothetical protein
MYQGDLKLGRPFLFHNGKYSKRCSAKVPQDVVLKE